MSFPQKWIKMLQNMTLRHTIIKVIILIYQEQIEMEMPLSYRIFPRSISVSLIVLEIFRFEW